ncbi:MAG: polyprenyl synthetase family protein [Clostridia bacterium]|nr:polyprenyl synthetase family protein [Clostridia bacterium]
MNFKDELKKYANIINNEIEKTLIKEEVIERKLNEATEYSLMAGGKRIRPVLMLATYNLFKKDIEVVFPYAVSMEMIHNFSLIHDDLPGIDNDDFRHGKPTNHKAFGEATAILAGDLLLNRAYLLLGQEFTKNLDNIDLKIRAFNELTSGVERMIIGEYVDTEFEGQKVSDDYLEYMHKNKTGALIKASIRIGAILAGASEENVEKLSKYGEYIGLAFQIKDDILDVIGDVEELGKPVGNDIEKHKSTFITKYGLEESINRLNKITEDAVAIIGEFENGEFLKELAIYIRDRKK